MLAGSFKQDREYPPQLTNFISGINGEIEFGPIVKVIEKLIVYSKNIFPALFILISL